MLLTTLLLAAPQGDGSPMAFQDQSEPWGVFHQDYGGSASFQMGAGAAWVDVDGDGDEDLFLLREGGEHRLFERTDAGFVEVTDQAKIPAPVEADSLGVIAADFDQDGRGDLYVTNTGVNQLLHSQPDGTFLDRAAAWRVGGRDAMSTSASVADFDRDGDLDLYVGNYVRALFFPYHTGEPNALFINEAVGSTPLFVDRAYELGVQDAGLFGPSVPDFPYVSPEGDRTAGATLSTCTLDYDDDGWQDILVGNDFGEWVLPNRLYRNTTAGGSLSFEDVNETTGFGISPHYNMGINPCDFDHDGDWDFYLSNLGDNVLLRNDDGVFVDATVELGPVDGVVEGGKSLVVAWGTVWQDLDLDGWEDLYVVNGHIPSAGFLANPIQQENSMWRNVRGELFRRVPTSTSGAADTGVGRSVLEADVNGDGLLDFYITNNRDVATSDPADGSRLFINLGPGTQGRHWLEISLRGHLSNREGLGTAVDLWADGHRWKRQLRADPVYLASATRVLHFGLGARDLADRIELRWPSGVVQELVDQPVDRLLVIHEPVVTVTAASPAAGGGLQADLELMNHAEHDVSARLIAELVAPTGRVLSREVQPLLLAPGTSPLTVAPAARGASGPVVLRLTVKTGRARDMARLEVTL